MPIHLPTQSHALRVAIVHGLSLFFTGTTFVYTLLYTFYLLDLYSAALESIYFLYSFYIYRLSSKGKINQSQIIIYVYFLILIIIQGSYSQPIHFDFFIWALFCPILLYLLLGKRHGLIMSGILLFIQLYIICSKVFIDANVLTQSIALVNLILCYLGIWIISHIYEAKRSVIEHSLSHLASRDPLTKTHNRLALTSAFSHFELYKKSNARLSLLIIDLDHFKQVNDQYGHLVGDNILIETAELIAKVIGDQNLYRIGGEEFCVTLFDYDLAQAKYIGEELCFTLRHHRFIHEDYRIQVTLSIGICEYHHNDSLNDLLNLADKELYLAKENGRNQVRICKSRKVISSISSTKSDVA